MDLPIPFAPSYFDLVTYSPLFKISRVRHHCHLYQSLLTRTTTAFLQRPE